MKQRILQHFRRRWFYYIALGLVGLLILDQLHAGRRLDVFSAQREIPTLVLDAGHGGFDGGAVSPNGVTEQQINLGARPSRILWPAQRTDASGRSGARL